MSLIVFKGGPEGRTSLFVEHQLPWFLSLCLFFASSALCGREGLRLICKEDTKEGGGKWSVEKHLKKIDEWGVEFNTDSCVLRTPKNGLQIHLCVTADTTSFLSPFSFPFAKALFTLWELKLIYHRLEKTVSLFVVRLSPRICRQ